MKKKKDTQLGKKLFFLFLCAIVALYCFYSDEISAFYVQHTLQVKLVSFLTIVFLFLFCPFNFKTMYRFTNNMNEMDVDGKYNYWLQMRNQMDTINRASRVMNGEYHAKRNVNGYRKRLLAANQFWKCGHCRNLLDPAFEVDHIIALSEGGTNNDDNLICLCRNCHGKKTFTERA